ncbi:hypothetical protein Ahy_A01g000419 [Arachis hypogaea]|uniref:Uncharacterized protein n=1 Tax=Arachis hypogaea TaxID=3818 RepID=A0A445EK77_ARAHY|nr:hypothetical protein Ahy_A01g000419 [Arachis hypogaea]
MAAVPVPAPPLPGWGGFEPDPERGGSKSWRVDERGEAGVSNPFFLSSSPLQDHSLAALVQFNQCLPSNLLQFRESFKPPVPVAPPPLNSSSRLCHLCKSQLVESSNSSQHRSSLCHLCHLRSTLSSRVVLSLLPPVLAFTTFAVAIAAYNSAVSAHFLLPEYFRVLRASSLPYELTAPALALLLVFRTEASYASRDIPSSTLISPSIIKAVKFSNVNLIMEALDFGLFKNYYQLKLNYKVFSNYFMASNAREDTQSNSVAPNDNKVEVQSNANPTSETPQATDNVSTPEGSTPNEGDNKTHVKSVYWDYFDRLKVEGEWKAKCKFCKTVLSANPRNGLNLDLQTFNDDVDVESDQE